MNRKYRNHVDVSLLRKILDYDKDTGILVWRERPQSLFKSRHAQKAWNASHAGKEAFRYINPKGYKQSSVLGGFYYAHRIAWAIYYGEWPESDIDHIDHNGANNAIDNLRLVTMRENARNVSKQSNNTSGVPGVYWDSDRRKWRARIRVDGRNVDLGRHDTIQSAEAARLAANKRFGFHPNHGADIPHNAPRQQEAAQ